MDSDKKVNLTQNFKDKIEPKSQFLKKKIPTSIITGFLMKMKDEKNFKWS